MSDHNTYLVYKKQTRYILWWLCHTSNAIVQSLPKDRNDDSQDLANTTGQVTTSELVTMAQRVALHLPQQNIHSTIFRLFHSVISARSSTHAMFVRLASDCEDEKLKKSNETHKHFIDRLTEAFEVLGGRKWIIDQRNEPDVDQSCEDIENVVFYNAFSVLEINSCTNDISDDEAGPATLPATKQTSRASKVRPKQRSKRMKDKRTKPANKSALLEVPLEDFCILDEPESVGADYIMASASMLLEWTTLREHVQRLWLGVAYKDMNIAVAGAVSEMAIAMIKRTALAVDVEFPAGHDTFQSMTYCLDEGRDKIFSSLDYDVEERFSLYTYHDFLEFVGDFQKNRSGTPTKRMQATLSTWNPDLDLQQASDAERVEWRRLYTISWLFEMVNVFSQIVIRENKVDVGSSTYDTVHWSVNTPFHRSRRLFGMERFAETITTLAMQKPGTEVRSRILPHHVFQLQCVVDSFTASCGWSPGMRDSTRQFRAPPERKKPPIESIMSFLGTESAGFLSGARAIQRHLDDNSLVGARLPLPQQHVYNMLNYLPVQVHGWLGKSDNVFTSENRSRFSRYDSNGLWNYSPLLCGVGLMEALEISYRLSMLIWEALVPEPFMLLCLADRDQVKDTDGLFSCLTRLYSKSTMPSQSPGRRSRTPKQRPSKLRGREVMVSPGVGRDISTALSLDENRKLRHVSTLMLYRMCDWDPARILQNTGSEGSMMKRFTSVWEKDKLNLPSDGDVCLQAYRANADEYNKMWDPALSPAAGGMGFSSASTKRLGHDKYGPCGVKQLIIGECDMLDDICKGSPASALDYMWLAMKFINIFKVIEQKLDTLQNPIYLGVDHSRTILARYDLFEKIAKKEPGYKECMQVVQEEMKQQKMKLTQFIYWGTADVPSLVDWMKYGDEQSIIHAQSAIAGDQDPHQETAQENSGEEIGERPGTR